MKHDKLFELKNKIEKKKNKRLEKAKIENEKKYQKMKKCSIKKFEYNFIRSWDSFRTDFLGDWLDRFIDEMRKEYNFIKFGILSQDWVTGSIISFKEKNNG